MGSEMCIRDRGIGDVEPFIDWNFFFPAWGLKGRCPDLFDHPERGDEARKLFDDAQALLHRIADERLLTLQGVVGIYPAVSRGDDILLTDAKGRRTVSLTNNSSVQYVLRLPGQNPFILNPFSTVTTTVAQNRPLRLTVENMWYSEQDHPQIELML